MHPTRARLAALLAAPIALGIAASASALQIYVDQTATYHYINATGPDIPVHGSWFAPGFDDSSWNVGNGPFSSGATSSTILDTGNVNAPFAPGPTQATPATFTQWDINHDAMLRTTFQLAKPTDLSVWIAIDNGLGILGTPVAGLYVNGVQTTNAVNAEGHAFRWEVAFNIPKAYTVAGNNLIALQLEDHGGSTGFDMMVTAQAADSTLPPFTTNPPPAIPEAQTWLGLAAGLGVVGLLGRRRKR